MLRSHRDATFSHFTISEINGGIDGLLMASRGADLETGTERRLSQILDDYYNSFDGLVTKVGIQSLMATVSPSRYRPVPKAEECLNVSR